MPIDRRLRFRSPVRGSNPRSGLRNREAAAGGSLPSVNVMRSRTGQ
jgi:hypothetical protein